MLEVEKLAKKDQKKLSSKERRRVRDFLIKKAKIPPFDEKCKQCGRPIPAPLEFCSSHCKGEYYGWKIREEKSKRTQRNLEVFTEDHN